jgi:2,3-dihydroxyphenylpropionate 1,2-dioxygenase
MSEISGFAALSHSPFWDQSFDITGPGEGFVRGVEETRQAIRAAAPDLVVVFGPDHYRNFFLDVMPAFCVGIGEIEAFGDYGTYGGPIPSDPAAGRAVLSAVRDSGFDPAFSLRMGIDHGITQPYQVLVPEMNAPMLPIMVDCGAAPRPSFRRAFEFGMAVGAALRQLPGDRRIQILASGGLSHWVATPAPEEADADMRDFLIDGRDSVREYNLKREESVAQRAREGKVGRVNSDWDRWFIERLEAGAIDEILDIDPEQMESVAGNGSHEVLSWVAGWGAWNAAVRSVAYEPVPRWVTGMGIVAGAA